MPTIIFFFCKESRFENFYVLLFELRVKDGIKLHRKVLYGYEVPNVMQSCLIILMMTHANRQVRA